MGIGRRWQEYARQYGWGGFLRHIGHRLLRPIWEEASVLLLAQQPPAPTLQARVPLEIAHLTRERAANEGLLTDEWALRWAQGHICYAAWYQGRFIHHSWVARDNSFIGEVHASLRMGTTEAYVYDCFTDGTSRGMGVFPAVLSLIGRSLFSQGVRLIWIAVEEENRSSLKAIQRAGYRPAGEIIYRRVGRLSSRRVQQVNDAPPIPVE